SRWLARRGCPARRSRPPASPGCGHAAWTSPARPRRRPGPWPCWPASRSESPPPACRSTSRSRIPRRCPAAAGTDPGRRPLSDVRLLFHDALPPGVRRPSLGVLPGAEFEGYNDLLDPAEQGEEPDPEQQERSPRGELLL